MRLSTLKRHTTASAEAHAQSTIGGDLNLNIWMVNVLGSIYSAKGWDQPGTHSQAQFSLNSQLLF